MLIIKYKILKMILIKIKVIFKMNICNKQFKKVFYNNKKKMFNKRQKSNNKIYIHSNKIMLLIILMMMMMMKFKKQYKQAQNQEIKKNTKK